MPEHLFRTADNIHDVSVEYSERKFQFDFDARNCLSPSDIAALLGMRTRIQHELRNLTYSLAPNRDYLANLTLLYPEYKENIVPAYFEMRLESSVRNATYHISRGITLASDVTELMPALVSYKLLFPRDFSCLILPSDFHDRILSSLRGRTKTLQYIDTAKNYKLTFPEQFRDWPLGQDTLIELAEEVSSTDRATYRDPNTGVMSTQYFNLLVCLKVLDPTLAEETLNRDVYRASVDSVRVLKSTFEQSLKSDEPPVPRDLISTLASLHFISQERIVPHPDRIELVPRGKVIPGDSTELPFERSY